MATITIDVPTAAVPRIKAALRNRFASGLNPETGQPHPEPTNAELLEVLQLEIKEFIKREVRDFESRQAEEQARASITDIDII